MHQVSLIHFAQSKPLEPLLEKGVQMRAYELYQERGKREGFALQDWLQAEADVVRSPFSIPTQQ